MKKKHLDENNTIRIVVVHLLAKILDRIQGPIQHVIVKNKSFDIWIAIGQNSRTEREREREREQETRKLETRANSLLHRNLEHNIPSIHKR